MNPEPQWRKRKELPTAEWFSVLWHSHLGPVLPVAKVIPQRDVGLLGHIFIDDAAICSRIHQEIQMERIKLPHKCARKHRLVVFPDEEPEASAFVSPVAPWRAHSLRAARRRCNGWTIHNTNNPCGKSSVSWMGRVASCPIAWAPWVQCSNQGRPPQGLSTSHQQNQTTELFDRNDRLCGVCLCASVK